MTDPLPPLSPVQARIAEAVPPGAGHHPVVVWRLHGDLHHLALRQAVRDLVARHESLRTTVVFPSCDVPRLRVWPAGPVELRTTDLTTMPARDRAARAEAVLREVLAEPYDLVSGPLLQTRLVRLTATEHLLVLRTHRLVADAWSRGVLGRDLSRCYAAALTGRPVDLPELPARPAAASVAVAAATGEGPTEEWPVLPLPTRRTATSRSRTPGEPVEVRLPAEVAGTLAALAARHGGTLSTALLTGVQVVLARYTRQRDVALRSEWPGRGPDLADLVGAFAEPVVVRRDVDPEVPFARLLAENATDGGTPADPAPAPERTGEEDGVRVLVCWGGPAGPPELPALRVEELCPAAPDADLVVEFTAAGDGSVRVTAGYDGGLLDRDTVGRLIGRLPVLLAAAAADPTTPVGDLPLLDEEEQRTLRAWEVNQVDFPADRCVPDLVAEQVAARPGAVAVQDGERKVTYAELDAWANRLAHLLLDCGARPGTVVGVCLPRGAELYAALLAVLRAGCAYLPLDPGYPEDRLRFMLADAAVEVCLTERGLVEKLGADGVRTVRLDEERERVGTLPTDPPPVPVGPRDAAYVIYTSGSTGQPKGTVVEHRSIIRLVCSADYAPLQPDDVVAQAADASFDAATFEIWGPLLSGARIVTVGKDTVLDPGTLVDVLTRCGVTTLFLTTAVFNQIVAADPAAFRTLRHLLFGGEAVNPTRVAEALASAPPRRLLHVYGPTETTTFATWHLVREADPRRTVPIGGPIANTSVRVLDDRRRRVPVGVVGELYIGGPGVARGYLNRPQSTAERFLDDPFDDAPDARLYRTGDLVRWAPEGVIEYLGRTDHQVKLRGFRIEPGEIELVLQQHPDVAASLVVLHADGEHKRLVGYVRPVAGRRLDPAQLREFAGVWLPEFMVPAAVVPLDEFPLTANGKVDRAALPDPVAAPADDLVEPRTETEQLLAAIWSEVLGLPRVGVFDNFYELGGDSVLGIKVAARARRAGLTLAVRDVFRRQTIAELATVVTTAADGGPAASTVA